MSTTRSQVSVYMDSDLWQMAKLTAAVDRRSVSSIVGELLAAHVAQRRADPGFQACLVAMFTAGGEAVAEVSLP